VVVGWNSLEVFLTLARFTGTFIPVPGDTNDYNTDIVGEDDWVLPSSMILIGAQASPGSPSTTRQESQASLPPESLLEWPTRERTTYSFLRMLVLLVSLMGATNANT
jgi:hypothetical protein